MSPEQISERVYRAVGGIRDQESFIQGLLAEALGWPIEQNIARLEDISYS